jgi:transaldolase
VATVNLYLDSTREGQIRNAARYGLLDGVTTNPSLVADADRPYREVVETAAELVDGPVFGQTTAADADGIDGKRGRSTGPASTP